MVQSFICVVTVQCILLLAGLSAFHAAAFSLDRLRPGYGVWDQGNPEESGETNARPEDRWVDSAAVSAVSLSRLNDDEALLHVLIDVHLDKPGAALPAGGTHLHPHPEAEHAPSGVRPAEPTADSFSIDTIDGAWKGPPDPVVVEQTIAYVCRLREKLTGYIADTTGKLARITMQSTNEAELSTHPRGQLNNAMERAKDIIDDFISYLYGIKTQLQVACVEAAQLEIAIGEMVLEPVPSFKDDRTRQSVSPTTVQTLSDYGQWLVDFLTSSIPTANELVVKNFPRFRAVLDADDSSTLTEEREHFTRSLDEYRDFLEFLTQTLAEVPDVNPLDMREPSRV